MPDFSLPPIAAPAGSPVPKSAPLPTERTWKNAPFAVKIGAFGLTILIFSTVSCGLSMLSFGLLFKCQWALSALCVGGLCALLVLVTLYLRALGRGWKRSWYLQMAWFVIYVLTLVAAILWTLVSGTFEENFTSLNMELA